MIDRLKPYPAYKNSGVPWLGMAPEHWDIRRAKYLFRESDDRSATGTEELLSVSHITGITPRSQKNVSMFLAESTVGHKLCLPDDVVVNTMWAWMAALGVARQRGLVSPSYAVYRPVTNNGLLPEYVDRLLRTQAYASEYLCASTGINTSRLRLYPEQFLRLAILRPPQYEQALIVRFLDHADRRIRRYIRAKKKLVARLNELKQAVTQHVVSRGFDVTVQCKSSAVEWLGDVPKGWEVVALRLRYSQCLGKMLDSKRVLGVDSLAYLRNTDVQWDRIATADLPLMDIAPSEYERYTVRIGDLLVCEGGEVGRSAIWNGSLERCGFQKALHRLRPLSPDRDAPRFLYYVLRVAANGGAFDDGHASTIAHLTGDKLRAHRFPFPPKAEQDAIVTYLDSATTSINLSVLSVEREIDLLREYRTRLFADVVTGTLDVREVSGSLPDEAEPDPFDDASAEQENAVEALTEDADA